MFLCLPDIPGFLFTRTLCLQGGVTPLMGASEQGHIPVVETLLKHSATIDLKDEVQLMYCTIAHLV